MKFFTVFILFLSFSSRESAGNPLLNARPMTAPAPAFYPQFSQPVSLLPQGTPLMPICYTNSGPACFNQWTNQAIPMAVKQGSQSQFNYFIPSFIPYSRVSSESIDMKAWTRSSSSPRDKLESRSFYFNNSQPEKTLMIERDSEGKTEKVLEGRVVYINLESIEEAGPEEPEEKKENVSESKTPDSKDPDSGDKKAPLNLYEDIEQKPPSLSYKTTEETVALPARSVSEGSSRGGIELDSPESQKPKEKESDPPPKKPRQKGTEGKSTALIEVKPGCFIVNKEDIQTEASFCFECIRDIPENEYFLNLLQEGSEGSFLSKTKSLLAEASQSSKSKIDSKTPKSLRGKNRIQQICDSQNTLSIIINNFEKTCPAPYWGAGGFKKFFRESLCKSCQRGVPVELMMAMMSIESAGKCAARNTDGENSSGLFQVDSNQHKCKEGYRKKTERNAACLTDIHNNWNASIKILEDFYNWTNGKKAQKPCKDWINMEPQERDAFRRAVSGYNGGIWLLNSIRAAKGNSKQDRRSYAQNYKYDTSSWEEIRAFFFTQQIKPDGFKKRGLRRNLSNLAHTEAILGREVKNSIPGMIEVWSQYKREFLNGNAAQCEK